MSSNDRQAMVRMSYDRLQLMLRAERVAERKRCGEALNSALNGAMANGTDSDTCDRIERAFYEAVEALSKS